MPTVPEIAPGTGMDWPAARVRAMSSMLDITEVEEDGTLILQPCGKLDTLTAKTFEDRMSALVDSCHGDLLVDMGRVDYVSSFGLRSILIIAKKLAPLGRKFVLFGPNPTVYEALRFSGFLRILTVTDTKQAAIAVVANNTDTTV